MCTHDVATIAGTAPQIVAGHAMGAAWKNGRGRRVGVSGCPRHMLNDIATGTMPHRDAAVHHNRAHLR